MSEKILSAYLAGAIRDANDEDITWREQVIVELDGYPIIFMNPLAGKRFDAETQMWTVSGVPSTARFITRHDKWYIENSDIVIFNFRALSQGYPNIGTLVEFGMAVALKRLIYVIVDPDYTGTGNVKMFRLHPFIEEFAATVFPDVDSCLTFLKQHIEAVSGRNPHYQGE